MLWHFKRQDQTRWIQMAFIKRFLVPVSDFSLLHPREIVTVTKLLLNIMFPIWCHTVGSLSMRISTTIRKLRLRTKRLNYTIEIIIFLTFIESLILLGILQTSYLTKINDLWHQCCHDPFYWENSGLGKPIAQGWLVSKWSKWALGFQHLHF